MRLSKLAAAVAAALTIVAPIAAQAQTMDVIDAHSATKTMACPLDSSGHLVCTATMAKTDGTPVNPASSDLQTTLINAFGSAGDSVWDGVSTTASHMALERWIAVKIGSVQSQLSSGITVNLSNLNGASTSAKQDVANGYLTTISTAVGDRTTPYAVKPVDSTGADASDTTNHAWKVNCVTGCSGSGGSSQPYQPDSYTPATLAVTTTSSRVAAPGTGTGLVVTNTGSTPVFVNVGGSTVTATTANLIINPGNFFGFYYPGGSAYVAAVTASGSGSLSVVSGTGMPNVGTNTDQTASITVSGTVGLAGGAAVAGPETQGAAVVGGLVRSGCRAAATTPIAVADGQAVDPMCSLTGKSVTVLYAPSSFAQRGAANTAATTAQALTSWVTPGAGQFAYVTRMECGREDTGTTNIHITMNDTASSTITLPAGSGNNPVFDPPLKVTASATAPTFTLSAAVSGGNVYCSAQGYNE